MFPCLRARCVSLSARETYRYTVTTRMACALRWAAMRAFSFFLSFFFSFFLFSSMFHNCEGQSHKTVSTDHDFWRQRRAAADSNRGPSADQPNALPLGQPAHTAETDGLKEREG